PTHQGHLEPGCITPDHEAFQINLAPPGYKYLGYNNAGSIRLLPRQAPLMGRRFLARLIHHRAARLV
ncbi:hypothetical protein ACFLZW_07615, partial [Chloroflexota bacterium]